MHARRAMEAPLSPLKLDTVTFSIADGTGSPEEGNTVMEVISWRPRAVLLHSFLAPKMCDYLVEASVPKMGVSKVGSESTVGGEKSKDRDSTSTWIGARLAVLDPVFSRMRRRAALFAAIPETHQELIQVLRYEPHQKFLPHLDAATNEQGNFLDGYDRLATLLVYLEEADEGGQTYFPKGNGTVDYFTSNAADLRSPHYCHGTGSARVKPKKGDALLFFSLHPNAVDVDETSLHESCPVIKGTKWTSSIWMHRSKGAYYPSFPN